jgi:glycosyl transferase family 2
MAITLSILICSMTKRHALLHRLYGVLAPQRRPDVEILTSTDDGQLLIGSKRNGLLRAAQGTYVAFVDDDDRVSADYVGRIIKAVETKPDCVGMEGLISIDGRQPKKFIHSLRYGSWFEKNNIYYRNPNHLNPIRRDLAIAAGFPEDVRTGEDHKYSVRLQQAQVLKTEVYLDGPIYFYDFLTRKA